MSALAGYKASSTYAKLALITFIIAKVTGLCAVALGFASMTGDSTYKIAAWLAGGSWTTLLVATVILCVLDMNGQNKKDESNTNVLSDMLDDGTLEKQLLAKGYRISKIPEKREKPFVNYAFLNEIEERRRRNNS